MDQALPGKEHHLAWEEGHPFWARRIVIHAGGPASLLSLWIRNPLVKNSTSVLSIHLAVTCCLDPFFHLHKFFHLLPPFLHNRPGLSLWQVPPIPFLYLPHTFLSPSYRPGLSLWQVPPISFLYLPHTFPSPSYRPGLSLWQVPPISFSLSLIGPACHCGRSRLSPLSIFFTFLPLSLSYRPGLSLWQVPPFLSPFLPSSPSSPFHFPLFYRPGLSLWQVPPIFDFTSII